MPNENDTEKKDVEVEKVPTYFIHNTSRSRHNRSVRAAAPQHGGHKQYIGGEHRLVRGRPLVLSEDQLMKHLPELVEKQRHGLIDVKTPEGRSVDLATGETVPGAVAPPPKLPNRLPDSIQRDKPAGNYRPQIAGGYAEGEDTELPDLVGAAPSDTDDDDEDEGDAPPPVGGNIQQAGQQRSGKKKGRR